MTRGVLAVCLLLLAGAAVGGATAGASAQPTFTQQDFDRTEFRIQVFENGSARWTFTFVRRLDSEEERAAFENYATQFESEETELYANFRENARELTARGTNETGREMTAMGFTRAAFVDEGFASAGDERGLVRISFRWTDFAATDGDRVVVGDVFEGGFYIGPSQSLVFAPGPGMAFGNVDPAPDSQGDPDSLAASDSVTWQGEESFIDQRPRLVLVPEERAGASPTGTASATGTASPTGTPSSAPTDGGGDGVGLLGWLALAVVLLLGGGAGYAYRSGQLGGGEDDDGAAAAESTDGTDGSGGAVEAADAGGEAAGAEISDEELMSDEDRVVSMLEERGGRMKQVKIVEETGWSKSKVSMLLSDMEEEEQLSKLRVGRENIVSLAGHEPEAAKSPFEDQE